MKKTKTSLSEVKMQNEQSFVGAATILSSGIEQVKDEVKSGKPLMIIIDGPAGIGKSTFSNYLYKKLSEHFNNELTVSFLEQDLFGLTRASRIELDVHPCADAARDAELFTKADELLEGNSIKVPRYNKTTGGRIKNTDTRSSANIIIYEGVSSLGLYLPGMQHKDQVAFRIFVQPENEVVLEQSRKERDTSERNITTEEFEQEWERSQAYNWIFTYRGRQNANLTLIRREEKSVSGSTLFDLIQVDDIQYRTSKIDLKLPIEKEFKAKWKAERAEKLKQSPQLQVYAEASIPIVERAFSDKIPGKMQAKQALFDTIRYKQGLGNAVALMSSMQKSLLRDGPIFVPSSNPRLKGQYAKFILESPRASNPFKPSPSFSFSDGGEQKESVIFNTLEPSTAANPLMFGLSNLILVLTSTEGVINFLKKENASDREIQSVVTYQAQLKDFYNPSYYYRLQVDDEYMVAFQPTTPYFKGQILFADRRGKLPSYLEEKGRALTDYKLNPSRQSLLSTNSLFTQANKKLIRSQSMAAISKSNTSPNRKSKSWEYEDTVDFLMRTQDLTLEAAYLVQNEIVTKKAREVSGHKSQTNIALVAKLLNELKAGDQLGQNSPSAITDENSTHLQCFNESESGILPIFSAHNENEIEYNSAMACYQLDYPVAAFKFVCEKLTPECIAVLKEIQDVFLKNNQSSLPTTDQSEIALIARKTNANTFEIVAMLRKDLHYHNELVQETAQEILIAGAKPVYNKRPGFLELAGCFLQDNVQAYDVLTDDNITRMLSNYSASDASIALFSSVVKKIMSKYFEPTSNSISLAF